MERRNFISSLGRYTCFGILAAVSVIVLRRAENPADGNCTSRDLCSRCNLLAGCELPGAMKEKQDLTEQSS